MDRQNEVFFDRKEVGVRLLYTLLFTVVLGLLKGIVVVAVMFQYLYVLVTGTLCEPVREFSSRLSFYTYRVMMYMTLGSNGKPFPFTDFPDDPEGPVSRVNFRD